MALPVVTFDNSGAGSDTAASGAGPATAIFGTHATLNASAAVNLSGDSPDLSGVATDGSAVLWVQSSSGAQYRKITAVNNGTKVVNVELPYAPTESNRNWAIGGKRATLDHANTRPLFVDARPGWIIDLIRTGTDYLLTSALVIGVASDATAPITFKSSSGTRPVIKCATDSVNLIHMTTAHRWRLEHLYLQHTATTRGIGIIAKANNSTGVTIYDCVIDGCSMGIDGGFVTDWAFEAFVLDRCEVKNCISHAVRNYYSAVLLGCYFHDNGGDGFNFGTVATATTSPVVFAVNSIFARNGGDGVSCVNSNTSRQLALHNCVLEGNTGDGLDLTGTGTRTVTLQNCIFYGNGGWGVTAPNSPTGLAALANAYGANSLGARNNVNAGAGDVTLTGDPFTNRASGDYTLNNSAGAGAACRSAGWPGVMLVGTGYADIGALRHQDPATSGGGGVSRARVVGGN